MTDTYEFLKAQKDAILAKKEADENEWLKAAAEDIAHYKQERDLALAECERLRADAERLDYLQSTGSTVSILPRHERIGRVNWAFQIGGLFSAVNSDIRAAIDVARGKP